MLYVYLNVSFPENLTYGYVFDYILQNLTKKPSSIIDLELTLFDATTKYIRHFLE